jgi:hypothetical protein
MKKQTFSSSWIPNGLGGGAECPGMCNLFPTNVESIILNRQFELFYALQEWSVPYRSGHYLNLPMAPALSTRWVV